jgi:pyridoxal biosynthesis lyase PdxS
MTIPVLMNWTTNILDMLEKISEVLVCADSHFAIPTEELKVINLHLRRDLAEILRMATPAATI